MTEQSKVKRELLFARVLFGNIRRILFLIKESRILECLPVARKLSYKQIIILWSIQLQKGLPIERWARKKIDCMENSATNRSPNSEFICCKIVLWRVQLQKATI